MLADSGASCVGDKPRRPAFHEAFAFHPSVEKHWCALCLSDKLLRVQTDDCVSDVLLSQWAEGIATPDQVSSMTAHLAGCGTCRVVLAELTRDAPRPAGDSLGRYQLKEKIGAGGMGTVYAAWDPSLQRTVAVKILHETHREAGHQARRFVHERHILAGLAHPNIARLLDGGETPEGRPYFVMEFVDGQPLDLFCEAKSLPTRARLALMLPVFDAVTYAHQHLVVHRDLKPSNILVTREGVPKLVDFGIARLLEQAAGMTATGMAPMTPAYASPEQVRQEGVSTTSDVYSLGVVLHEVLTGTGPYAVAPGDLEGLLRAVREAEPSLPSQALARVPDSAVRQRAPSREQLQRELRGDVDSVVGRALRKEARDRYGAVQALADDVKAILEGRPPSARRGNAWYRAAKFVRRNKPGVAAAAAAVLALSAGLVTTLWQARQAQRKGELAQRRFAQVRSLAHAVLFDYHDGIAELPGSTPLRERLAGDAQAYLDALAQEAADDVDLRRELAQAYLKVGDVKGDPFGASLGDTAGAKTSYLRARELATSVVAVLPADLEGRRAIAASHEKVGALLEVGGELRAALAEYERARALDEALSADHPADQALESKVARDDLAIGQVLLQLGEPGAAAARLEPALAVREALARGSAEPLPHLGVASVRISLSDARRDLGRLDEAIALVEETERQLQPLTATHPGHPLLRRGLRSAWQRLGDLYTLAGAPERAAEVSRRALAGAREDLAQDPTNAVARRDLMVALDNLGRVLDGLGNHQEALAVRREALTLQRSVADEDPTSAQARRDLCGMLNNFGSSALALDDLPAAEAAFAELLPLANALLAAEPENLEVLEYQVDAHRGLAQLQAARGEHEKAIASQQRALASLDAALALNPKLARVENRRAGALAAYSALLERHALQLPGAARTRALGDTVGATRQATAALLKLEAAGQLEGAQAPLIPELRAREARCETALWKR